MLTTSHPPICPIGLKREAELLKRESAILQIKAIEEEYGLDSCLTDQTHLARQWGLPAFAFSQVRPHATPSRDASLLLRESAILQIKAIEAAYKLETCLVTKEERQQRRKVRLASKV